jgi:hypothetical protein
LEADEVAAAAGACVARDVVAGFDVAQAPNKNGVRTSSTIPNLFMISSGAQGCTEGSSVYLRSSSYQFLRKLQAQSELPFQKPAANTW